MNPILRKTQIAGIIFGVVGLFSYASGCGDNTTSPKLRPSSAGSDRAVVRTDPSSDTRSPFYKLGELHNAVVDSALRSVADSRQTNPEGARALALQVAASYLVHNPAAASISGITSWASLHSSGSPDVMSMLNSGSNLVDANTAAIGNPGLRLARSDLLPQLNELKLRGRVTSVEYGLLLQEMRLFDGIQTVEGADSALSRFDPPSLEVSLRNGQFSC